MLLDSDIVPIPSPICAWPAITAPCLGRSLRAMPAGHDHDWHVGVVREYSDFLDLAPAWNHLLDVALESHPHLTHEWFGAWWEAFSDDKDLYIICVWDGEELVGTAPLAYERRRVFGTRRRVVSLLSNVWTDRTQFVVADHGEDVLDVMIAHLFDDAPPWDLLDFEPLDQESDVTASLLRVLTRRDAPVGLAASLQSPYLRLPDSWDALLQTLAPSFRQSIRRKLRGAPSKTLRASIARDADVIDTVMDISLESWQHDAGTSMASEPHVRRFYERIMGAAARTGSLRVALLEDDGRPIAFEFNLAYRDRLYNLKLGYRKAYAHLSPGLLLKCQVLRTCLRDGTTRLYDFMGTDEPYKRHWSKTIRAHHRILVFGRRWNLRLVHALWFRLRPYVRTRLPWLMAGRRWLQDRISNRRA